MNIFSPFNWCRHQLYKTTSVKLYLIYVTHTYFTKTAQKRPVGAKLYWYKDMTLNGTYNKKKQM